LIRFAVLLILSYSLGQVFAQETASFDRMPWVDNPEIYAPATPPQDFEHQTPRDLTGFKPMASQGQGSSFQNSSFEDIARQSTERYKKTSPSGSGEDIGFDIQIFISAGMPEGVLRHLFKQALEYPQGKVRFVVRGFEPQRLGQLIGKLRSLFPEPTDDRLVIEVDPNAFRDYGVDAVPVYLVREKDKWFEVRGAVSIAGAEENVRKKGSLVCGDLYAISEPDILAVIEERAKNYDWRPAMDRARARLEANLARTFDLPTVTRSEEAFFTPNFTVPQNIVIPGYNGNPEMVVARAGDSFNVLDFTRLQAPIIVFDQSDPRQIKMVKNWLEGPYAHADVFVVGGMPASSDKPPQVLLAEQFKRPVYPWFGRMTDRFGVRAVPAIVDQVGKQLRIRYVEPKGF